MPSEPALIRGGPLLREIREAYQRFRPAIEAQQRTVTIIRFAAAAGSDPYWAQRMEASRISAEQKVKNFEAIGFRTDHRVVPDDISRAASEEIIAATNDDPRVISTIVQFPPPMLLRGSVHEIASDKDIDGLLGEHSSQPAPATAEGIARIVEPFLGQGPVTVVGSEGFIGRGVMSCFRARGANPVGLDAGDDLSELRHAAIVVSVTGQPGLLRAQHLARNHQLVVDSGFMPREDGSVLGDVHPEATTIPHHITPVPGESARSEFSDQAAERGGVGAPGVRVGHLGEKRSHGHVQLRRGRADVEPSHRGTHPTPRSAIADKQ